MKIKVLSLLLLLVAVSTCSALTPLTIKDADFENPVIVDPNTSNSPDPNDWMSIGYSIYQVKTGSPSVYSFPQNGDQYLFLGDAGSYVCQTINDQMIYGGDQYTMLGYVSRASYHQTGFQYQVVFYTAEEPNLAPGDAGTEIVQTISANDYWPGYGPNWTQWQINWTAEGRDNGKYLGIQLKNAFYASAAPYEHVYFDNLALGVEKGVPSDCNEAIAWGWGLAKDFSGDCVIGLEDLEVVATDWVQCVVPGQAGCDQPWSAEPDYQFIANGDLETLDGGNNPDGWTYIKDASSPATGTLQVNRLSPFTNVYSASTLSWQFNDWATGADYKPQLYQSFDKITGGVFEFNFDFRINTAITPSNCMLQLKGSGNSSPVSFRIAGPNDTPSGATAGGFVVNDTVYTSSALVADDYYNVSATLDVDNQLFSGDLVKWDSGSETMVFSWTNVPFVGTFSDISQVIIFDAGTDAVIINFDNFYLFGPEQIPANCAEAILKGYGLDADFTEDCKVDLMDFSKFAEEWLDCIVPGDVDCTNPWL